MSCQTGPRHRATSACKVRTWRTRGSVRWVVGVLWLVLLLIVVASGCSRQRADTRGASELRKRLERSEDRDRFSLHYTAGGTAVLDCFQPNRDLSVTVDRGAGVLVISRLAEPEQPVAMLREADVYLSNRLFAEGTLPAPWLRLPAVLDGDQSKLIVRLIGGGMAGYLFAEGLPPNGREAATEVLAAADDVARLPAVRDDAAGDAITMYEIRLDAQQLAEATRGAAAPEQPEAPPPVVQVGLDARDRVRRLTVNPTSAAEPDGVPEEGWAVDYLTGDFTLNVEPPNEVIDIGDINKSLLQAAAGPCVLN